MKYFKPVLLISLLIFMISACQSDQKSQPEPTVPQSQSLQSNGIEIIQAWARPASAGANSAVYLRIFNGSNQADTLVSIDAGIATQAEVHESFEENGLSSMRSVNQLVIPADSSVSLAPGGYHIMLKQLNQQVAVGDSLSLQLNFAIAGARYGKAVVQLSN